MIHHATKQNALHINIFHVQCTGRWKEQVDCPISQSVRRTPAPVPTLAFIVMIGGASPADKSDMVRPGRKGLPATTHASKSGGAAGSPKGGTYSGEWRMAWSRWMVMTTPAGGGGGGA